MEDVPKFGSSSSRYGMRPTVASLLITGTGRRRVADIEIHQVRPIYAADGARNCRIPVVDYLHIDALVRISNTRLWRLLGRQAVQDRRFRYAPGASLRLRRLSTTRRRAPRRPTGRRSRPIRAVAGGLGQPGRGAQQRRGRRHGARPAHRLDLLAGPADDARLAAGHRFQAVPAQLLELAGEPAATPALTVLEHASRADDEADPILLRVGRRILAGPASGLHRVAQRIRPRGQHLGPRRRLLG